MDEITGSLAMEQVGELERPRFTDPELLQLRLTTFSDEVMTSVIEGERYQQMTVWQQETTRRLKANTQPEQTVDLPTRSGKSYMLRDYVEAASEHKLRSVILAPRQHILAEHADELAKRGISVSPLDYSGKNVVQSDVQLATIQTVARNRDTDPSITEDVDIVMIDEVHKALGEKTLEGVRNLFPNAVFVTFSATTEYADNRSVTDEYGAKVISRSVVEAIRSGVVPPVRAFLYKTEAEIKTLDPNFRDFTPRELEKLAHQKARNNAITDFASDLVADGRQGIITTIPGEDLLHAEMLRASLVTNEITLSDGTTRNIRAEVVRGGQQDLGDIIDDFNSPESTIDILLYCDVLREGTKLGNASFLINGRPTTSIVNLTQDIGRILEPKGREMVVIDFKDKSVKTQRTVFDVLELDRSTQGVLIGPDYPKDGQGADVESRESFLRGLFRPELADALGEVDNRLLAEFDYKPETTTLYERLRLQRRELAEAEAVKQTKIWNKVLRNAGLEADQPDTFMAHEGYASLYIDDEGTLRLRVNDQALIIRESNIWPGFEQTEAVLPVEPMSPKKLNKAYNEKIRSNIDPIVESDPHSNPEVEARLYQPILDAALDQLTARQRTVVDEYFGLLDGEPKLATEAAVKLGIIPQRVRTLAQRALVHMRDETNFAYGRGFFPSPETFSPGYQNRRNATIARGQALAILNEARDTTASTPEQQADIIQRNRLTNSVVNRQFEQVNRLFTGNASDSWADLDGFQIQHGIALVVRLMTKVGLDPQDLGHRTNFLASLTNGGYFRGIKTLALIDKQSELTYRTGENGKPYSRSSERWQMLDREIDSTLQKVAENYMRRRLSE